MAWVTNWNIPYEDLQNVIMYDNIVHIKFRHDKQLSIYRQIGDKERYINIELSETELEALENHIKQVKKKKELLERLKQARQLKDETPLVPSEDTPQDCNSE